MLWWELAQVRASQEQPLCLSSLAPPHSVKDLYVLTFCEEQLSLASQAYLTQQCLEMISTLLGPRIRPIKTLMHLYLDMMCVICSSSIFLC